MIYEEKPSKTRRKKQMHELQALGEQLLAFTAAQLDSFGLPEDLRAAVAEAQGMQAREPRRRQIQYIGRLMREVDAAPIRDRIAAGNGRSREQTAMLHETERWRERLLEDDAAIEAFLRERPEADGQRLRALVHRARSERAAAGPPRGYRELFRMLRDIIQAP